MGYTFIKDMVMKWLYSNLSFFNSRKKKRIVFCENLFSDSKDISRGDMGFVLSPPDGFLKRIRLCDSDVSVRDGTFVSLNGIKSIQPFIRAIELYERSVNGIQPEYHLKKCVSELLTIHNKLNGQHHTAKIEIQNAVNTLEYYKSTLSWSDYAQGEIYFMRRIGNAILEIINC